MGAHEFDIRIDKDGQVRVKVHGSSGEECMKLSDMIRDIIGREESRELTSEYYGTPGRVRIDAKAENNVRARGA
jgi:hypothetical protein